MKSNLHKAGAILSTVSLLGSMFASVAGASIDGVAQNDTTGADSKNEAKIEIDQGTFVTQNNRGTVVNKVDLFANTGGNTANKNTGAGDVATGDVSTGVGISNKLNQNIANMSACGGCDFDIEAGNTKTGADSKNETKVEVDKETILTQDNDARITNDIYQKLNTGDNKANKNTGLGYVDTGDVDSVSLVSNQANKNWASLGAGNGGADLKAGNDTTGADSDNEAKVEVDLSSWAVQNNRAHILNDADIYVNTGRNAANKNTGAGDVLTGDIYTGVGFYTAANANFLAFDGCCDIELDVENEKTGADSKNEAKAELKSENGVVQGNCAEENRGLSSWLFGWKHDDCGVFNYVDGDLNTGENKTNKNTNDGVDTGSVDAAVEVITEENRNVLGSSLFDLPDVEVGEHSGSTAWWMLFFGLSA